MPNKQRYPATAAWLTALGLQDALEPFCERIVVAGSLRRNKSEVGDIELLYIPKISSRPDGMFDATNYSEADEKIEDMLQSGILAKRPKSDGTFTWGAKNKLAIHVASGIPVDLFSTDEDCWWVSLVVRTGSKETNLKLTTGAQRRGGSLVSYGNGVRGADGVVTRCTSERQVFELCGVEYLEPEKR